MNTQIDVCNGSFGVNGKCGKTVRKLVPDGIGFTEDTYHFRLPEYQPRMTFGNKFEGQVNGNTDDDNRTKEPEKSSTETDAYTSYDQTMAEQQTKSVRSTDQTFSSCESDKTKANTYKDSDFSRKLFPAGNLDGDVRNYSTSELEEDSIHVEGVVRKKLPRASSNAPDDFVYNFPTKHKRPDSTSKVQIPHLYNGTLEYDEFGAELRTFKEKERGGVTYYRHFLVKILPNAPAEHIGIEENDEIVLLLGNFVPDLDHQMVLKTFHKIKVDGKTRFEMVIRRTREKRCIWMEFSAILAPESGKEEYPVVEHPVHKTLKNNCHVYSDTPKVYQVPGTQLFIQIVDGIVSLDVIREHDKTKVIWKRVLVCQSEQSGEFKFEASLADETKSLYINIDKFKHIVLNSEPQMFQIFGEGDKIRFRTNDVYIGYDRLNKEIKAQQFNCAFKEFPAKDLLIGTDKQHLQNEDFLDGFRYPCQLRSSDFEDEHYSKLCEDVTEYALGQENQANGEVADDVCGRYRPIQI